MVEGKAGRRNNGLPTMKYYMYKVGEDAPKNEQQPFGLCTKLGQLKDFTG